VSCDTPAALDCGRQRCRPVRGVRRGQHRAAARSAGQHLPARTDRQADKPGPLVPAA